MTTGKFHEDVLKFQLETITVLSSGLIRKLSLPFNWDFLDLRSNIMFINQLVSGSSHLLRYVKWCALCIFLVISSTSATGLEQYTSLTDLKGSVQAIPKTFFGMHIHRADTTTVWPIVKFGSWRLWDANTTWFDLEPEKGKWNFQKLDRYVELARLNGVDVSLPLGMTPTWASDRPMENSSYGPGHASEPANMGDWRNYVHTVARRYKGRIRYYEIWNEPNNQGFFTGDMAKIVELTRIASEELKSVDSGIQIVSPGIGDIGKRMQWLDDFLRLGGGQFVDIIGYHFYVPRTNPEAMLELVRDARQVMRKYHVDDKPLWNTEAGWLIANEDGTPEDPAIKTWIKLDRSNAGGYIARAHILAWAAGVERYYWYSWEGELVEPTTHALKLHAVNAYTRTIKWLQGSVINGCKKSEMIWNCSLTDQRGRKAWLVWTEEEKAVSWNIPNDWQLVEAESLDGLKYPIEMKQHTALSINQSPVLLRSGVTVR